MRKLLGIVLFVFVWQIVYFVFNIQNYLIPQPVEIAKAFWVNFSDKEIFLHIFSSLQRVIVGFLAGSFLGVSLAIVLGYHKKFGDYITPIIEILRPIPPIAWIPIAILIFGLGNESAYFIVFLGSFFPIFTNSYFGVISLPAIYKNVADTFEIKRHIFIKDILFYFSLPYIFTGLKIGMGMAWMSVIAAELIGAQSGLGYFIQLNRLLLRTDNVLVGMILIGLIGFLLTRVLSLIEIKATPWIIRK